MINFFRKIRQNQFSDLPAGKEGNQFSKYLMYAAGEIILVVFGILIALQINNWNEQRKLHFKVKSVYSIIKNDLQTDIKNIDFMVTRMESQDSIFRKVINNRMTIDDYQNCEDCLYIISGYPDIELEKRGFKLLEENSTLFDTQKDSLILNINNFYSLYNIEISVALREMASDFGDNYTYWKNNMPWFNDYYRLNKNATKNEELLAYVLTSDYRNRVGSFYVLHYHIYLEHLKAYKNDALSIIEDIEKKTE